MKKLKSLKAKKSKKHKKSIVPAGQTTKNNAFL